MKTFPSGARVCFVGDSLTASNQPLQRIIDHYNKNFKERGVRFFNCGTSGGTYKGAIDYFYDDVLSHNPTHVVVAFGVNDSKRWLMENEKSAERFASLKDAFEMFKKNVATYCEMVLSRGIELTLCTPAPYDEYSKSDIAPLKGGYALMLGYSDFIRTYAKENNIDLCDYHEYLCGELEVDEIPIICPDRVHPTPHGYYLIAKHFLAHQGLTIDEEAPIPEYFAEWHAAVAKLRIIFSAEEMVVHNYQMPLEEKMAMMEERVRTENWGQAVMERYIRAFVQDKRNQPQLYKLIDELYERDVHLKG